MRLDLLRESFGDMGDVTGFDSQRWIDEHGDALYRFALVRVRDASVAEDLVQETFLAALQGARRESGETAERRWMIGIIKHKIVDHFRRMAREPLRENHPDELLERKQFWDTLAVCLDKLPPRTAQVFTLREMDEMETDEICRLLCLTQTNLGVMLHRARKQLRNCLPVRYFGQAEEGAPL